MADGKGSSHSHQSLRPGPSVPPDIYSDVPMPGPVRVMGLPTQRTRDRKESRELPTHTYPPTHPPTFSGQLPAQRTGKNPGGSPPSGWSGRAAVRHPIFIDPVMRDDLRARGKLEREQLELIFAKVLAEDDPHYVIVLKEMLARHERMASDCRNEIVTFEQAQEKSAAWKRKCIERYAAAVRDNPVIRDQFETGLRNHPNTMIPDLLEYGISKTYRTFAVEVGVRA